MLDDSSTNHLQFLSEVKKVAEACVIVIFLIGDDVGLLRSEGFDLRVEILEWLFNYFLIKRL